MRRLLVMTAVSIALLCAPSGAPRAEPLPPGIAEGAVKEAKTPEQHQAIADAYAREAADLAAQAKAHRSMDSWYNEPGYLSSKVGLPRHCRALTQALEAAAKEADAMAKAHHEMAEAAARQPK